MSTIAEKLIKLSNILKKFNHESADLESSLLLSHVLKQPPSWLISHSDQPLTASETAHLEKLIKRLIAGEPLSQILETQHFIKETIRVTSAVLTPRFETEVFISDLIKQLSLNPPRSILDVGTGSGAIAISLARAFPDSTVTGSDISPAALDIARQNGKLSNLKNLTWLESDLFAKVTTKFNLIVANLPYLTTEEMANLPIELSYEPAIALSGGADGDEIISQLIKSSSYYLQPEAVLALEIHPQNMPKTVELLQATFPNAKTLPVADLAGSERFIITTL